MKNIIARVQSPTPKFFVNLRNISLILNTVTASVFASPVALPAVVIIFAGYLALAGGVAGAATRKMQKYLRLLNLKQPSGKY